MDEEQLSAPFSAHARGVPLTGERLCSGRPTRLRAVHAAAAAPGWQLAGSGAAWALLVRGARTQRLDLLSTHGAHTPGAAAADPRRMPASTPGTWGGLLGLPDARPSVRCAGSEGYDWGQNVESLLLNLLDISGAALHLLLAQGWLTVIQAIITVCATTFYVYLGVFSVKADLNFSIFSFVVLLPLVLTVFWSIGKRDQALKDLADSAPPPAPPRSSNQLPLLACLQRAGTQLSCPTVQWQVHVLAALRRPSAALPQ